MATLPTTGEASAPPSPLDLYLHGFGDGIEGDSCLLEIRLALLHYRKEFGRDHWRLYLLQQGRA
jgi:hypothetical protein